MTAQLFVALPNGETRCLDTPSSGIAEPLRQDLEVEFGNGVYLRRDSCILTNTCQVRAGDHLTACLRLLGGKGGYGNTLRAMGRKHGTGDIRECRDLQGRRLRDLEAAKQAAEWAASQKEREEAKAQAKQEREQSKAAFKHAEEQEIQEKAVQAVRVDAERIQSSVQTGLKRSASAATKAEKGSSAGPLKKRSKLLGLGSDDESSEEDDTCLGEPLEADER